MSTLNKTKTCTSIECSWWIQYFINTFVCSYTAYNLQKVGLKFNFRCGCHFFCKKKKRHRKILHFWSGNHFLCIHPSRRIFRMTGVFAALHLLLLSDQPCFSFRLTSHKASVSYSLSLHQCCDISWSYNNFCNLVCFLGNHILEWHLKAEVFFSWFFLNSSCSIATLHTRALLCSCYMDGENTCFPI